MYEVNFYHVPYIYFTDSTLAFFVCYYQYYFLELLWFMTASQGMQREKCLSCPGSVGVDVMGLEVCSSSSLPVLHLLPLPCPADSP